MKISDILERGIPMPHTAKALGLKKVKKNGRIYYEPISLDPRRGEGNQIISKENFADGKVKGKSRPGRVKKAGASCKGSVSSLRAKAKKYSGERGKMYHWCANMKSGKQK
jgi:hypothetical protein